eukprot:16093834-Heterocapsa_arctica.AAC.1
MRRVYRPDDGDGSDPASRGCRGAGLPLPLLTATTWNECSCGLLVDPIHLRQGQLRMRPGDPWH